MSVRMSSQERWPPSRPPATRSSTSGSEGRRRRAGREDAFQGLTSRRRRRILAILVDGTDRVPVRELANRLAAVEEGVAPMNVPDGTTDAVRVDLRHVHLPALANVGLLDWDETDGTVAAADHPAFEDPAFRHLVETRSDVDDVVACLSSERRRLVLAILQLHDEPVSTAELAEQVAAHEPDPTPDVADVRVALHHVHLPKLADVGLVEHDTESGTVDYRYHPDVDEAWFAF